MATPSQQNSYRVLGVNLHGHLQELQVTAQTQEEARLQASSAGFTVLQCDAPPASPGLFRFFSLGSGLAGSATKLDVIAFAQDMATLLSAGVTVKEAIHALAQKEQNPARQHTLAQLDLAISEGLTFSAAMQRTGAFPELMVATVAASEQTGDLAIGLQRYASHQQSLRQVRDKVIGASVYPLLLLAVGGLVIVLLLGVVVPRFASLIDANGRELPVLSRLLMDWGRFVADNRTEAYSLFFVMVAVITYPLLRLRDPAVRRHWLSVLPGFASIAREFQHLQMYRTTAILTSRGIIIHKALQYSMELLSPADQQRLQAALNSMTEGVEISTALSRSGLSDTVATSMLGVAERTGSLSEMLDRIADFYERALQRRIDLVSRLIEPAMMIIFGIVIGGIVIMMYLPIFDLAASVS